MNTNFDLSAIDVAVNSPMSASRGILALQGIGLSGIGAFGTQAKLTLMHAPVCTVITDKPSAEGWHPSVSKQADDVMAVHAGYEPAVLQAARLRTADPATVIRTRQRCRIPR